LIDILKLDSAYAIGWSDGGNAALILAEKRPDKIKKAIASGANYTRSGDVSSSFANDTLQLIPPDYQPPPDQKKWIDKYFIANKLYWRKIINDRKIMWAKDTCIPKQTLLQIKIPILIVLGDRDVVTLKQGIEMHRLIEGSQFCVLPNTSHNVFGEKPDLVDKIAIDFFTK
jgi:pimeloyl-ACP methyl ester carboxylesterase